MYLGQEILWTQTVLSGKILWLEIFRPCNKSYPWFGLKSLVIPEPFPLSPDPGHILGFEPWAHIPCYDPVIGHLRSATARYSNSSVVQSSLRYLTFAALMSRLWMLQPFWDLIRNMPAPYPQATSSTLWSACIMLLSKSSSYTAP